MPFDIDARIADWQKSLLDTTKRNRLIKFASGRGGGVGLLHPGFGPLWQRMVVDGQSCVFAWKRDVLGLPAEAIDGVDEPSPDPGVGGTGIPSPTLFDAVPPTSTTPSPPVATPTLRDLTARCLMAAMAAVGLGTGLSRLRRLGWKAFCAGLVAAAALGGVIAALIKLLGTAL